MATKKITLSEIKNLIRESINEISPELSQRAAIAASQQPGREAQAQKFQQHSDTERRKAKDAEKEKGIAPVQPFVGQALEIIGYQGNQSDVSAYPITNFRLISSPNILWIDCKMGNSIMPTIKYDFVEDKFIFHGDLNKLLTQFLAQKYRSGDVKIDNTAITQKTAQLLWKIAKAINPETKLNPNTLGVTVAKGVTLTQQPTPQPEQQTVNEIKNLIRQTIQEEYHYNK